MDILLWRHAEALDGSPDHARALSPHGEEQAGKVALWLRARAPENLRLLVSPAIRTRQTAAFFQDQDQNQDKVETCAALYSGTKSDVLSIIEAARTPLLFVGHQPLLGKLAARLAEEEAALPERFRKGALWWLRGKPGKHTMKLWQTVDADALPAEPR
ncbi:MAG: histidine phosphatase family protein [Zoogloeaceae bacterium]|jgi:phosphohistidine phosphatase|nr:histidine phosphatase family protein [Zoogloeaceae bacterium]